MAHSSNLSDDFLFEGEIHYFKIFKLPIKFDLDTKTLTKYYYELSRQFHPDRVENGDEKMSLINDAYETLKKEESRRDYIFTLFLTEEDRKKKSTLPLELAEEWFELKDLLDEPSSNSYALIEFQKNLESRLAVNLSLMKESEKNFDHSDSDSDRKIILKKCFELLMTQNVLMSLKKEVDGYLRN